jgi:glycyl-tRNA synthetase
MTSQEEIKKHLIETQMIQTPCYNIYSPVAGLQDYGINGFKIKTNILKVWRDILYDLDIHEVESPIVTSEEILKSSGHLDRFFDYVVYDSKNKCYRADHLVKAHLKENKENTDQVDSMTTQELENYINNHKLVDMPVKAVTKSLMFKTEDMYLRPELAQSIFVCFKYYHDYLKKLPFGIAQTGKSYRMEVSPKPFLRLREFTQAEIEYFFDPENQNHELFESYKTLELPLFPIKDQLENSSFKLISLECAVGKIIFNQIMCVMLAKIYNFALNIGLHKDKIRFRQHLPNEKAHYSLDCWDLECLIDNDWVECVGCAYRQDYDLKAHSKHIDLKVQRNKLVTVLTPNTKEIGKQFKKDTNIVANLLTKFILENREVCIDNYTNKKTFMLDNFEISPDMINMTNSLEEFYPHVIEPSFGIDRLIYATLSQNFWKRTEDNNRIVLSLLPHIAPYHVAVLPLFTKPKLLEYVNKINKVLLQHKIAFFNDTSSTNIGKKYVCSDELGIPYAITIDYQTLEDDTVTIRYRDDMSQVRVNFADIIYKLK